MVTLPAKTMNQRKKEELIRSTASLPSHCAGRNGAGCIAHVSPSEVAKARDLLQRTNHQRIDHHRATAAATESPGHQH